MTSRVDICVTEDDLQRWRTAVEGTRPLPTSLGLYAQRLSELQARSVVVVDARGHQVERIDRQAMQKIARGLARLERGLGRAGVRA